MLLTLSTTHRPAIDLGYLLAKNPSHTQTFPLSFGKAHVFYPEATDECCTAALLLDVDPVGLVRGKGGGDQGTLAQYVNDRPYVASSFLSVAIAQVFGSALNGRSKDRPELTDQPIPLVATLTSLPCRGGEAFLRRLFEPIGYQVTAERLPLDATFPEWGLSSYYNVTLRQTCRLSELLTHLYVLVPVLDDKKHYWVGQDEVDKLITKGEGWLASHPEKEQITFRYLKHRRPLQKEALARLVADTDLEPAETEDQKAESEERVEARISLNEARLASVVTMLRMREARTVLDLGCGEGKLLKKLIEERAFDKIAGCDVSIRCLEIAKERLRYDDMPEKQRRKIELFQASVVYRDARFSGYDAVALVEVIEHVDLSRLAALTSNVFEHAAPKTVIVTTPNAEYNAKFAMPEGSFRHADHRFEWTRHEFKQWAQNVADQYGYTVEHHPIGDMDETLGAPTQMAVFVKTGADTKGVTT
ncbi:MAG: 3' terminal RNA ribose 2'-O-methyltransferase Hen1 [Polyangiaceae bacterium]|nr:3' terminal RNA ribose 2'-O-methyltransferase Hen1 [Polyangiaceae bacterium]